jgi:hypothetical protein
VLRWWDLLLICQMAPLMPGLLAGVVERLRRELEFWRWRRDYERFPERTAVDLAYRTTERLEPVRLSAFSSVLIPWPAPAVHQAGAARAGNSSQLDLF